MPRAGRIAAACLPILLLCSTACGDKAGRAPTPADVAIYEDDGCWEESIVASERMFRWMGRTTDRVDAAMIRRGDLSHYRLLCVPGGNMYEYALRLSAEGRDRIAEFVDRGGGYVGICGGGYYAAREIVWSGTQFVVPSLGIFAGTASGPLDSIAVHPEHAMCTIRFLDPDHPIRRDLPDTARMLYYWGPGFAPDAGADVSVLARYEACAQLAMLAFAYGDGRVFLIGTHPEIEEDSDRDGVDFADDLDDEGSDWDLMRQAVDWCLGE